MEPGKPIQFQPITPGLGFHPFSDGLPYAPVSKNPSRPQAAPFERPSAAGTSGAGAIAAGAAAYAPPRVSVPVANPPQAKPWVRNIPVEAVPFVQPKHGFGYLAKRVLAYSIDSFLNIALLSIGLGLALFNQNVDLDALNNPGIILVSILFFMLFNWALVTAQEIAFGTSVGKRVFRLALQGGTTAIFLRAFFFLPSVGFCGVGLLWSLFDRQKRCWHDRVVDIQPAEIARF